MTGTTIKLVDASGLNADTATVWVAGYINDGTSHIAVLTKSSGFATQTGTSRPPKSVPFHKVSDVGSFTLSGTKNGNNRLIFTISKSAPSSLSILGNFVANYTQYPYAVTPVVPCSGPFDIVEFGYDQQYDISSVNGFGLNLTLDASDNSSGKNLSVGVNKNVDRETIGKAWHKFIKNQTKSDGFSTLLYDDALPDLSYKPPLADNQFFALCDPADMLAALTNNWSVSTKNKLADYWDDVLINFFKKGNWISINLNASTQDPAYFAGECDDRKLSNDAHKTRCYRLYAYDKTGKRSKGYHDIYPPGVTDWKKPGLEGAKFVFLQGFGTNAPSPNKGMLTDVIWEALSRGVAQSGVMSEKPAGDSKDTIAVDKLGYSTTKWNESDKWYPETGKSNLYAKFLHCADADGKDSRISKKKPIFINGAAYGFSMDENPLGPYSGPNVPSKTPFFVGSGETVTITVGKWSGKK